MRATSALRVLRSAWTYLVIAIAVLVVSGGVLANWSYNNNDWVRFHVEELLTQVHDLAVHQAATVPTPAILAAAPTFALTPTQAPTAANTATPEQTAAPTGQPGPTQTAAPTVVPTATAPPLPSQVALTGFHFEYQGFNNCGPTTLAIALSYWGWTGGQKTSAPALKPDPDDKNVSPNELYQYALTIGYDAYIRVDGTVDTIRRFLAAGYPVVVEKGFTCTTKDHCSGWFGHYSTVTGYNDAGGYFILQDSYFGPNFKMSYADFTANWRAFNYLYIVFFPAGAAHDTVVQQLLGPAALNVNQNYHDALARAQKEALSDTGEPDAFAWFNVGTSLADLQDYAGAAAAYDQARQIGLPYRMLWYQFQPFVSYYYMARYQDVVDLATFAINSTPLPGLEESYYWRGQAEQSLGQPTAAIADYQTALQKHPGYKPATQALQALGQSTS